MESKQRRFVGLTVAFAMIGVGLLVTAFATDNWVSASPHLGTDNTTAAGGQGYNTGSSSFGLFNGKQWLKYQTGSRSFPLVGLYAVFLLSFFLFFSTICFFCLPFHFQFQCVPVYLMDLSCPAQRLLTLWLKVIHTCMAFSISAQQL